MASFFSSASTDMARLWPGTSGGTVIAAITQTATQFRITVDLGAGVTYDILYSGSGFTYAGLTATGGTYISIQMVPTGVAGSIGQLTGVALPLADIYAVSLATLLPLAGNDNIVGGTQNDTLRGGAGNDTITDQGGAMRDIIAGAGDDTITLFGANLAGRVNGGSGTDSLVLNGTLSSDFTVTSVEILNVSAATASAAVFDSFDTIRVSAANLTGTVSLNLTATGAATVLNLTDELTSGAVQRGAFVTGSADRETITTASGNDRLYGGLGNDLLNAGAGNDWLLGGDGDDTLNGGDGADLLIGELGNDSLNGGEGNDDIRDAGGTSSTVNGGGGDDQIVITDTITTATAYGGAGNDTIQLGANVAQALVYGGGGDDLIRSVALSGTIDGGAGNDTFAGAADLSQITLIGIENLQGSFTMTAAQAAVFTNIIGGIRLIASGSPVVLDLRGRPLTSVEGSADNETLTMTGGTLIGAGGSDILTTLAGNDVLYGDQVQGGLPDDGNDVLNAGAGNDALFGGGGNDVLNGADGDDSLFGGAGRDTLNGGAGNDRMTEVSGGDVSISGGSGNDQITLSLGFFTGSMDGGADFDTLLLDTDVFATGISSENITGVQIARVERLVITDFVTARAAQLEAFEQIATLSPATKLVNIKLVATGTATLVDLFDEIVSLGAFGTTPPAGMRLFGSSDDETIVSTQMDDILDGGRGNNTISYAKAAAAVAVNLSIEDLFQDTGGAGRDALSGFDNILGSRFGDTLIGSAGDNVLNGGRGNDRLTGGAGRDSFVFGPFAGVDTITDFNVVADTLHLDNAAFVGLSEGGLLANAFAANMSGAASDPFDRVIYEIDTGRLYFDADGAGGAAGVHFATLRANLALTNADFLVI